MQVSFLYTKKLDFKNLSVFTCRARTGCITWFPLPWAVVFSLHASPIHPFGSPSGSDPDCTRRRGEHSRASKRFIDPGCTSQQPSAPPTATRGLTTLPETHFDSILPPFASAFQNFYPPHHLLQLATQPKEKLPGFPSEENPLRWEKKKTSQKCGDPFFTSLQIPTTIFPTHNSLGLSMYKLRIVSTQTKNRVVVCMID